MADEKLTALDAIASIVAADIFHVVNDVAGTPTNKKATFTQLITFIGGALASTDLTDTANIAYLAAANIFLAGQTAQSSSGITYTLKVAHATSIPTWQMQRALGDLVTPTAVQSGDTLARLLFSGHDGAGYDQAGNMSYIATENFGASNHGTKIQFQNTPDASNILATCLEVDQDKTLILYGPLNVAGNTILNTGTLTLPTTTGTILSTGETWTMADGIKAIFNPDGTNAGINIGAHTSEPSSPVAGDIFIDSTANEFKAYINGAWVTFGTGGTWTDSSTSTGTNKTLNDFTNLIAADEQHLEARNTSGITMNKGDVVHISGYNVGAALPEMDLADANDASAMPAIGMVEDASIANNANGGVIISGRIAGIDTSLFSAGDKVYVSTTAGVTGVKPTGSDEEVQLLGEVLRSHATLGVLELTGAGRSNDVPNTIADNIFEVSDNGDVTKALVVSLGGATTSTATTIVSSQTGNRSITLPDATDTLVGKATTDTFTNKTLDANGTGNAISNINVAEIETGSGILEAQIPFVIDGGGSAITTGIKGPIIVPFDCTVTEVTMLADQSGSIVVDIWKDTYANYPPTDADTITASAVPTITTAIKSQDSTLTGWTTTFSAGDILYYNVDSITTVTRVGVFLQVTRT